MGEPGPAGAARGRIPRYALYRTSVAAACSAGATHHRDQAPPTTPRTSAPAPAVHPVAAPQPVIPHDYVAPAGPTGFLLTGPRFSIRAHVCAMPPVFPLDPPGEQRHTVCWVTKGFGFTPGSTSRTTYVLGQDGVHQRGNA